MHIAVLFLSNISINFLSLVCFLYMADTHKKFRFYFFDIVCLFYSILFSIFGLLPTQRIFKKLGFEPIAPLSLVVLRYMDR